MRGACCFRHFLFSSIVISLCSTFLFSAPTQVTVSGRKLLVAGQAFTIRGVDYSPTPGTYTLENSGGGCTGNYQWWTDRPTYIADFPLIQKLSANTIRDYGILNSNTTTSQGLQALDAAQASGLHVIMGFSVPTYLALSPSTTAQIQSQVLASISSYKNHPAVLMWMIGNEVNLTIWNNATWYDFLNTLAGQIKAIDPNHPVATAEGEILNVTGFNAGNAAVDADDNSLKNIDIWGINAYRGKTFEGLFQTLASTTTKPILITEFGKDAWHDAINAEDQGMQAGYLSSQWQEIQANLSATPAGSGDLIGGSIFEWTDEWWKDFGGASCSTHDTQVIFTRPDDTVDPNYQDEWFGLAAVSPVDAVSNPGGTARSLRKSYGVLQALWSAGAAGGSGAGVTSFFSDTVRNYPNPFRLGAGATKFVALVNEAGTVDIRIFDAGSQFVTSFQVGTTGPGRYEISWDGHNRQGAYVSPGLYFARIHGHSPAHDETQFRRVVGVK